MATKVEKKPLNKNAQKWVKALRSGKYKQTKEFLHDQNGFCCLGVACEVYNQEMKRLHKKQLETKLNNNTYETVSYNNYDTILPPKVRAWLNLSSKTGTYNDGDLSEMNDRGLTFKQIANVIERQPEGLFNKEN